MLNASFTLLGGVDIVPWELEEKVKSGIVRRAIGLVFSREIH